MFLELGGQLMGDFSSDNLLPKPSRTSRPRTTTLLGGGAMSRTGCLRTRFVGVPLLFFAGSVSGAVFYDNGVTVFDSYIVSQPNAEQLVADDFTLNNTAMIAGVQWKGSYSIYAPQQDNFVIQISADDNGLPSATALYTLNVGNDANRTELLESPSPQSQTYIFTYSANISPLSLPAGSYWLSIFSDSPNPDPDYRWAWVHQFDPPEGNEAIRSAVDQPYAYAVPYKTDFTLLGPSSVPVPAAAWLFGSGLIGLAGFTIRNRHRRTS
jgi:hypothetical protein